MKGISFIYKLLFERDKIISNSREQELFHTDSYLRPNHTNYKHCPHCKTIAKTNKEIVDIFGLKNINGRSRIQSWCKECRNTNEERKIRIIKNQVLINIT